MKLSCVSPISNNGNPTAKFPGSILKINPPVLPVNWCVALFVAPLIHIVKATELFKTPTSHGCHLPKTAPSLVTLSRDTPHTPAVGLPSSCSPQVRPTEMLGELQPWPPGSFPRVLARESIPRHSSPVPSIPLPSLPISFQFIYFSDLNPHLVV